VENKGCRRCDYEFECLPYIPNHCNRAKINVTKRYDDIVRRIKTAVGNPRTGCELVFENETIPGTPPVNRHWKTSSGDQERNQGVRDRCDHPFENGEDAFKEARKRKQLKYEYLKALLKRGWTPSLTVNAIIGSLGAWDPDNEEILKLYTSKFERTLFKRLCLSYFIK